MKINSIYSNFTESIANNIYLSRRVSDYAQNEIQKIEKHIQFIKYSGAVQGLPSRYEDMSFISVKSGKNIVYFQKTTTNIQKINDVITHNNKQYQWILSESFEYYEDFIESAYAILCSEYPDLWDKRLYGLIEDTELKKNGSKYLLNILQTKNKKFSKLINQIRMIFPEYAEIETNNILGTNIKFIISLIESMRHVIVHSSGIIKNKELFIKSVLENIGEYKCGNYNETYSQLFNDYIDQDDYENTFYLLASNFNKNTTLRLTFLIDTLLQSACVIKDEIIRKLDLGSSIKCNAESLP